MSVKRTPEGSWEARTCISGRQLKRRFGAKRDAEAWLNDRQHEAGIIGEAFTNEMLVEIRRAISILPEGISIYDAVRAYTEGRAASTAPASGEGSRTPIRDAVAAFLGDKKAAGCSEKWLSNLKAYLYRFSNDVDGVPMSEVGQDAIRPFLAQFRASQTKNNVYRLLSGFFSWSVRAGYASSNPMTAITKPQITGAGERQPEIFTPEQAAALMHTAEELYPALCPYFAIAMFAGVRPEEINRLDFFMISSCEIHIGPEISKTKDARYVKIESPLDKWLGKYGKKSGKVQPYTTAIYRKNSREVRDAAGIEHWPHDVLRHSYGSYHLAMHGNLAITREQMGHSMSDVFFRHYRRLVTRDAAKKFFAIVPQ